ncbi:MAG: hypothetical protein V4638_09920 [Bacteroidota bacterium]
MNVQTLLQQKNTRFIQVIFIHLLLFVLVTSCANVKNSTAGQTNKPIWHIYIGGKPHMPMLECQKTVAAQWGVEIIYFFGDCVGTFDAKAEEFETKNKKTFAILAKAHGDNWREKFDAEVAENFKKSSE